MFVSSSLPLLLLSTMTTVLTGVNVELGPPTGSPILSNYPNPPPPPSQSIPFDSDEIEYNNSPENDYIESRSEESSNRPSSLLAWLFGKPPALRRRKWKRAKRCNCGCGFKSNDCYFKKFNDSLKTISSIPATVYQQLSSISAKAPSIDIRSPISAAPPAPIIQKRCGGDQMARERFTMYDQRASPISSSSNTINRTQYRSSVGVTPCTQQNITSSFSSGRTFDNKALYNQNSLSNGNASFKCGNCGKWGHASSECPNSSIFSGMSNRQVQIQNQGQEKDRVSFVPSSAAFSLPSSGSNMSGSSLNGANGKQSLSSSSSLTSSSSSSLAGGNNSSNLGGIGMGASGNFSESSISATGNSSSQLAGIYVEVGLSHENCNLAASLGEALILNRVQGNSPTNILPPFSIQRLLTALNVTIITSSLDEFYKKLMENISSDGLELIIKSPERLVDSIMQAGGISKRQADKVARVLRVAINGYNSMAPDKIPDNVSNDQLKWILSDIGKKTSEKILSENCKLK